MSPLVDGNLVIVHAGGHNQGALTAFDVNSGEVKWSCNGDGPGYASPIVATFDGTKQIVTFTQDNLVADPLVQEAFAAMRIYTRSHQYGHDRLSADTDHLRIGKRNRGDHTAPARRQVGRGERVGQPGDVALHEQCGHRTRHHIWTFQPGTAARLRHRCADRLRRSGRANRARPRMPRSSEPTHYFSFLKRMPN